MTPKKLYDIYSQGFRGCIWEQHIFDYLMENSKYPLFGDANKNISDSGKNKLSTPYKSVLKFDKNPYNERQVTGDCSPAGTKVTMADGSVKNIEDVQIGDYVLSHKNISRKVTALIQKNYTGKLVTIKAKGFDQTLTSTYNHDIIWFPNMTYGKRGARVGGRYKANEEFKPIGHLNEKEKILIPYGYDINQTIFLEQLDICNYIDNLNIIENNKVKTPLMKDNRSVNRYIKIDSIFGWLIGIYLAEGGQLRKDRQDGLCFSFNITEVLLAEQVRSAFKHVFGISDDCIKDKKRKNHNVRLVKISNVVIAKFFKSIINANLYNKYLPQFIFSSKNDIKLACIRGWLDGDGHLDLNKRNDSQWYKLKLTGTSASSRLLNDMFRLSLTCRLRPHITHRKKSSRQKVASGDIHFYGKCATVLYPECKQTAQTLVKFSKNYSDMTENGYALPVESITYLDVIDYPVYCIEVEIDHTMIANGYGRKNCVSHGTRNSCDVSRAVEIDVHKQREAWIARGATEGIYGARGHGGQGMSCSRAASFVSKDGGILLRKNYPEVIDLTKYQGMLGAGWGGRGLPDKVIDLANDHQIKTVSLIKTVEEARDALANGYGIAVCSSYGFSNKRDDKGFAKTSGSWAHCYTSDSLVFTPSGYKTINNFNVGEKLFNHIGEIDYVSYIFNRDYDGDIVSIRAWGLPSFNVTSEHPILISRNITNIKEYDVTEQSDGGVLVIKKQKQKTQTRKLMWVQAKDITSTDWLVTPKTKFESKPFNGLPYIGINNKTQNIPQQLSKPNSDVAWMFGLYIADGNSVKNHKICFTFSITEKNYITRLKKAFDILGLKITIKKYKTYIRVYCYSSVLARSFDSWFGHYSIQRQIPEFLLNEGWNIENIIDGIFCGDGFYREKIKHISMSNKPLIYQLRNLLINLDYKPTIFKQKHGYNSYNPNGSCYTLSWHLTNTISKLKNDNNYLYNPIRNIKNTKYIGKVYNLEVKNNHSYIVDGVASHNCMAWIACDDTGSEPAFLVQNSWGCYSDDTEVLTKTGWKLFKNLTDTDILATLNPNNHYLEWQQVQQKFEYDYNGYLNHYHFRGVDLLVTDNHNMYIGKLNSDLDKIDSWQLIQSQNCPKHIHIKKNAKWKGEEVENIKINSNIISMDLWLEFLGYFISEGHTCSHKKVMSNGDIKYYGLVGISQNKKESREKMQNCVNKLPFRFSSNMVSYNKDLYNELKIYGKAHQKYIPDYIKNLSSRQQKIFFDAMMLGDGSRSNGKINYYTSSKKLADDMQELILKIGLAADIIEINRIGRDNGKNNYKNITRHKEYRLNIKEISLTPREHNGTKPILLPYNGKIYCATVPNHIMYVRRNGRAVWCGNSWNSGGHPEWGPIPDGSFLIKSDVAAGMLRANASYAFSNFDGFPLQKLPDYGFDYLK